MAQAAKLTLAGTTLGAIGIVIFVHYGQQAERAVSSYSRVASSRSSICSVLIANQAMHAGVIRDMEQQKLKRERQADFETQRALEQEYRKIQTVSDSDQDSSS